MSTEPSDEELVNLCLGGRREAFTTLVDRYQRKVYNLALGITGNPDDAMDATQNAFLKAFEHLRSFDPRYRFFSWLYRIGMNESLNLQRRSQRTTILDEEPETMRADPEARASALETGTAIRQALEQLSPQLRSVIVLRHLEGLTYAEIADVVGVEVKTVKSRLFSARRELRKLLAEHGSTPG